MTKYKNLQEWLNEKFPDQSIREMHFPLFYEKRDELEKLEGKLSFANYPNLEKITREESNFVCLGKISKVDISKNKKLKVFNFSSVISSESNLDTIDFSNCPELTEINVYSSWIKSLDLSKNPELVKLDIQQTNIEKLDLTNCPKLEHLNISQSQITELDLSNCPRLGHLYSYDIKWKKPPYDFLNEWKQQFNQINNLLFPNQPYNFQSLRQELKRLKTQDLAPQIRSKREELEQNTNNLKNNLGSAGKYLLEKLLKKQQKFLLNGENSPDKLEEIKTALGEVLENNQTELLQNLLNKQKELFNLEKHLASLQTEQQAQILQNQPFPSSNKPK